MKETLDSNISFFLGLLTFSETILLLTFIALLWYAWETKKLREEAVKQTELETRPIVCMYVRNINAIKDEVARNLVSQKYSLTRQFGNTISSSGYYISLRNMGSGPAFNVSVSSKNFKGQRYQTRFFAPKNDEHAVKIVQKPDNKIRNLEDLKNEIFVIQCTSILGEVYEYKYKMIDVEEKIIEFIA
ncbi:MAG: hypothetical protein JKX80_02420 [Candidatus Pacebacteria bacterium]|nr:hypothetical protein [Candidatus Paceibacterota bacterium]